MTQAKKGDTIKVNYKGTLEDGTIVDDSADSDPLEFVVGAGTVIAGFDQAVVGLAVGEARTVMIPATEAYGDQQDELIASVPRNTLPDNVDPKPGMNLAIRAPNGEMMPVLIVGVSDDEVTLDGNHPLAGRDLTFEIRLVEIAAAE